MQFGRIRVIASIRIPIITDLNRARIITMIGVTSNIRLLNIASRKSTSNSRIDYLKMSINKKGKIMKSMKMKKSNLLHLH